MSPLDVLRGNGETRKARNVWRESILLALVHHSNFCFVHLFSFLLLYFDSSGRGTGCPRSQRQRIIIFFLSPSPPWHDVPFSSFVSLSETLSPFCFRFEGERPYRCHVPECGRAFIQLSNLQQHLRNHDAQLERAKNRPFQCAICGKGFATESSLRTHTAKVKQKWRQYQVHPPPCTRFLCRPFAPFYFTINYHNFFFYRLVSYVCTRLTVEKEPMRSEFSVGPSKPCPPKQNKTNSIPYLFRLSGRFATGTVSLNRRRRNFLSLFLSFLL